MTTIDVSIEINPNKTLYKPTITHYNLLIIHYNPLTNLPWPSSPSAALQAPWACWATCGPARSRSSWSTRACRRRRSSTTWEIPDPRDETMVDVGDVGEGVVGDVGDVHLFGTIELGMLFFKCSGDIVRYNVIWWDVEASGGNMRMISSPMLKNTHETAAGMAQTMSGTDGRELGIKEMGLEMCFFHYHVWATDSIVT